MAYFINYIQNYSKASNKGRELQQYVRKFNQMLVKDDLSMDALKSEIEQEIDRLNKAYPRSKKLFLSTYKSVDGGWLTACVENNSEKIVCVLSWKDVLGTYCFSEKIMEEIEQ